MYSPNTEIRLLNTPFSIDGEHQIKFKTIADQTTYFLGRSYLPLLNSTFQRKDNVIRIPKNVEELYSYNYVMYKNTKFSDKYFYCYITKMEYQNEHMTYVYIKTDVFQTWYFDITFNQSFIDRQHQTFDSYNSIADVPAHGQLIEKLVTVKNFNGGYFVFCSSDVTKDDTTSSLAYTFAVGNYIVPCLVLYFSNTQASQMASVLQAISNKGRGDRILSAVYVPHIPNFAGLGLTELTGTDVGDLHVCTGFTTSNNCMETIQFDMDGALERDYLKELTYPYSRLVVTDMTTGQTIELSPEKFSGTTASFLLQMSISETPSYKIIPMGYDGEVYSFANAMVVKCSTTLPVANNLYAKYMMNNGEMNNLKKAFAGIDILGSTIGRSPMGVVTGIEQITNVVAQENQASKLGNQVTAITDGAMERIGFNNGIKISLYTMDTNHLKMARDYWYMYGYPIHSLGYPILENNNKFNFVKLISPNIEAGNVPQEDMLEIENIFTKGVTLWNSPADYKNY